MNKFSSLLSFLLFPLLTVLLQFYASAQSFRPTKTFTVNDGLPSNLIYALLEDNKGFLWIATDNGVVRFDGKYFRTFNTNDGLPDNEILEVFKEKDGTIWVNTFKQGPFYFDEKKNIFVDALKNASVNKDFINLVIYGCPLEDGGIVFYNHHGEFVFKDKKLVKSLSNSAYSFLINNQQAFFNTKKFIKENKVFNYAYYKENNRADSALLFSAQQEDNVYTFSLLDNRKLYTLMDKGIFYITKINDQYPYNLSIDSISIGKEILWFRLTEDKINITTKYGQIYSYDKENYKLNYIIEGNFIANCVWEDKNKNVWVGTSSKGIMLYKRNYIHLINLHDNHKIERNFMSIYADATGRIFAGNYFGEVMEYNAGIHKINLISTDRKVKWIRKIIASQNKIFSFSEQAATADYKRTILYNNAPLMRTKTALAINDSIIIIGGVNPRGGLYKLNTITEKVSRLNCDVMRVSSLSLINDRYIYLGTLDGVYKYDYLKNITYPPEKKSLLYGKRIMELQSTEDNLLCVATSTDGLYIVHNDKIIKRISNSLLSDNAITALHAVNDSSLWVGTRNGLNKIKYRFHNNNFTYKIHSFYSTDGLPANTINDITSYNNVIYVATENGICYLHRKTIEPPEKIKLYLTRMMVNNKDLEITNEYLLDYASRSIKMEFSGVDLGGNLKKLIYSLDNGASWADMQNNYLNLELVPGERMLLVKTSNSYDAENAKPLAIFFKVISPVYQRIWFLILVIAALLSLTTYLLHRNKIIKEKRIWNQKLKLTQERSRITADLHDDIGSTISSLQIYSEVAYNLIDTDKEKVRRILKHIINNSAKISEDISDIIWSLKGPSSSTLSLSGRIKNFITEVLGPTGVKYKLNVMYDLFETENIILCRKNIFLIIKEAINNMLKYSKADFVKIELSYEDNYYVLSIEDNGEGFDLKKIGKKGNGVGNMQKRTEDMGGHFQIITSPGNGTKIISTIPVKKI